MQALLNYHGVTQIWAHVFTVKVNLGYEAYYAIFLKTDTILIKFST